MKSLFIILFISYFLPGAFAQDPNDIVIKMERVEVKEIPNNITNANPELSSVPCIIAQPAVVDTCDNLNLFVTDKDEASRGALLRWFSNSVKATDPLSTSHDLTRGDFDLKGPGKTSVFCTKCNVDLFKGSLNTLAPGISDDQFDATLKYAYLEKQAENWASRFQNIRNNIEYLQVDANIHGLEREKVNAVADKCNMDKMESLIANFINKQEILAARTGRSSCPSLRNVDVHKFIQFIRRDSKVKEKRAESFKKTSELRMSSISSNVKAQYSTSCVNEALFQKSWGGFTPASAVNIILTTPVAKLNEKDFSDIIRKSILNDPKYNFMMTDPKQVSQLDILVSKLMKEVYGPMMEEYKKLKAKHDPEEDPFLKSFDPLLNAYQAKVANVLNNFDQERFNSSVTHLKAECDSLLGDHLEAVICHDPPKVDLTDLDLVANLNTQPSLEECIYDNRYSIDGLSSITPFCAKFLLNYCAADQKSALKNLRPEERKYRKTLGAAHMQQRNFEALKTKSLPTNSDYVNAIDNFEKNVCTPMIVSCKKNNPGLNEGSPEFRQELEKLTKEYLLTQKASDHYNAGEEVLRSLLDSLDSEKEKYKVARLNKDESMTTEQFKKLDDFDPTKGAYGSQPDENSQNTVLTSDTDGPSYLGLDDPKSTFGSGSDEVDSEKGVVQSVNENQNSFNQNNPFNRQSNTSYNAPLPVRSTGEIKKDEQVLETNKTQISNLKKQLEDKKEALGANYKNDPEYLAKEKKLKELEDKTRDLERKLLAEKDQRIKELEKLLAGKNSSDKDYKKLYEELNRTKEARDNIVSNGSPSTNGAATGIFAPTSNVVQNNPIGTASSSGVSSSNSSGSSSISSSGNANSSGPINNNSSVSGGGNYVSAQSSKPSDVPVISLTMEEFKMINHPNLENARKAVEDILKKHNGSVIGNYLYVQIKDEKGNVVYHSIDLKILKTGEKKVIAKNENKPVEKKEIKKDRKPSATVEELNSVFK